jgi:hypothetical protein
MGTGQAYSTALNWTEATSFVVGQQAKANKAARLDSSPNLPIALPLHFFAFPVRKKNGDTPLKIEISGLQIEFQPARVRADAI